MGNKKTVAMNHNSNLKSPSPSSNKKFRVWGFIFLLISYSFLAYKLFTFNEYPTLLTEWNNMPLSRFWWFLAVFILLPVNWLFESIKWKLLTTHIQKITLQSSIKAVLAGISTGFFTPNRVGELLGRILYLDAENQKAGATLSLVNSLTQNLIMIISGIPACILFFTVTTNGIHANQYYYLILIIVCAICLGLLYFFLPGLSKLFKQSVYSFKIKEFTDCLSDFKANELIQIGLVSLVRYSVFCVQFFMMLRFFGIHLIVWQALIAIPTNYLFVTFTPSLAFSEAAVRSSFAMLTIGAFSGQTVSIALAGMCIWIINFVFPMLAGTVLMVKKN